MRQVTAFMDGKQWSKQVQDETIQEAATGPILPARAIQALGATQRWARFAGTAMFGVALLKIIVAAIKFPQYRAQLISGAMHGDAAAGMAAYIFAGAVTVACYCLVGWFALRYARRLDRVKPPWKPTPEDIAGALGAQHRYWRLQGVLWIIGLALFVLAVILGVVLGLVFATR